MKGNILGDIRAENDADMLNKAFIETADYKALLESSDRCVIVGRRGTGKSALVHRLSKHWHGQNKTSVISLAPEEDQIIGLRGLMNIFGTEFIHVKAGAKLAWRYALYMELLTYFNRHYKLQKHVDRRALATHLSEWSEQNKNVSTKLKKKLSKVLNKNLSPEENIADLSENLELDVVEEELGILLEDSGHTCIVLIDRLDEGYTPDGMGVALVDGFVQAVIDLNSKFPQKIRGLVFLRDNMYRSIAINDPDFTRNIEGQVLRLHWDEYGLFNLVCNRLKAVHNISIENTSRVWNTFAARELKGKEGFRLALRLTLYRPRDILVLLNNAFLHAANETRKEIILDDINYSAKSISQNRLYDLHKEYESIFPAISTFTSVFISEGVELTVSKAAELINSVLLDDTHDLKVQQDIVILQDPKQALQRLYGIGFIGIRDDKTSAVVFCHDGRDPINEISDDSIILIHPCYWLALNLSDHSLEAEYANEIHDEYDIEISSITSDQRRKRIGQLIEDIKSIKHGKEGCHDFEQWCFETLRLIFAGALSNPEFHPNKNGRQQRDIVATNMATVPVWKRILTDYGSRQIVFEIKNYEDLDGDEYRQMNTYLRNDYGKMGFIITRSKDNNLKRKEIDWVRELYYNHDKIFVVKISEKYLVKYLSKLRSPDKLDAANIELNKLIDTYIRKYIILKSN